MIRIGYIFFLLLLSLLVNHDICASTESTNSSGVNTKLAELRQSSIDAKGNQKLNAINNLLKEAKKQNNKLYESIAYQHLATYQGIIGQEDSISFYLYKALESFDEIPDPGIEEELYNRVGVLINERILVNLLYENKKEQALYLIKETLTKSKTRNTPVLEQSAYANMGMLLITMKKDKEAAEALEKSLAIMRNLPADYQKGRLIHLYSQLVSVYQSTNMYDESILYTDSISALAEKEIESGDISEDHTLMANLYYANAYLGKYDLNIARKYLNICNELLQKNQNESLNSEYYHLEAQYALDTKNYPKALENIQKVFAIYDPTDSQNFTIIERSILLYTEILNNSGKSKEAFDLLQKLYNTNDSINRTDYANQMAELETIYQVEKLKDEAELNDIKFHKLKIQFIFSALLALSILIILLLIWYSNKRKHTNKLILAQKEKEIELKEIELKEIKELVIEINEAKDFHQEIVDKLDAYMVESSDYKQPNITRQAVAVKVGTNRQYLIDAIKSIKGQTFNEYLYTLRIEYAYSILISNTNIAIAEIQTSSGFVSQPVFNTAFKDAYNITPSELRKKIINGENISH